MSQFSQGWSPLPAGAVQPTQPTQPTGGAWTFLCAGDANPTGGPNQTSIVYQVDPPATIFGSFSPRGRYPTQQAAADALAAACGGAPTPQRPPPPPPPAAAPTQWFNVCVQTPNGISQTQTSSTSAAGVRTQFPNAVNISAPYATKEDADRNFDTDFAVCQGASGQTVSKEQPCKSDPLIACPKIPPGLRGLGTPGTAEWCAALDILVREIGSVGKGLYDFVANILDYPQWIAKMDAYIDSLTLSPVTTGVVKVIRQIFCWLAPLAETVREGFNCFRQWMDSLFPTCNNEATWGLILIRSFLLTLERFEWGTDAAVWIVARSGVTIDPILQTVEYLIGYSCSVGLISPEQAAEAFKHGYLDEKVFDCILSVHNLQRATFNPYLMSRGEKVGWREALQYVRRTNGTPDHERQYLRALGFLDPAYVETAQTLYDELPSISDHLEWLRKNVFDDDYVRDFRLMEGFEERFWPKFGQQLRALGMTKENASLHYAAHWINPSFQQQFQMVQRLREGRVPAGLQFTRADLLRTMQEMDVGPYFRERLEAVSHPIPNLTMCLQLFRYGTIDYAELVEKLKDLGYDDYNAKIQADAQVTQVRRLNAGSGHGWTPAALAGAYAVGKLTAGQVDNEMLYLGYSQDDSDRLKRRSEIELQASPIRRLQQQILRSALATQQSAYKCGAISAEQLAGAYKSAGIPDSIASIAVADVDAKASVALCDSQIRAFKRAFLAGKITLEQVRLILEQLDVPPLRVDQYLRSWALELKVKTPQATASQILRWVGQGLLDRETAAQRLLTLGWADPDLTLLLSESLSKLRRMQDSIQRQASRSQQAAARAALRAAQEAERVARQLRSKLRGVAPRSALQKWYREGLIDDAYFIEAMQARGYDDDSTLKYLAEAQAARLKAAKPPKAKSGQGVSGNGTA